MELSERIKQLSERIGKQIDFISTEEATKQAFIIPFIHMLGYDVFDPTEVVPEFIADVGIKKGEKIDYAVMKDGKPIMIFECKWCRADLGSAHSSQLFRYFSTLSARIAVLTNGIHYKFFTDLERPNILDEKPFLEINLLELDEMSLSELKKLTKSGFDIETLISTAKDLKYTGIIKNYLKRQLASVDPDFAKFLISQIYDGLKNQKTLDYFSPIVQKAFHQFLKDEFNAKIKTAFDSPAVEMNIESVTENVTDDNTLNEKKTIVETIEEKEGFLIVKSILREVIDVNRLYPRDALSYYAIFLDNNNRKPVCRLHFNSPTNKFLMLFDKGKDSEERVNISSLDDIYNFKDRLKETLKIYNTQAAEEV